MALSSQKIMAKVYDEQGALLREQELPPSIFGVEPKEGVVHFAMMAYAASRRTVSAHTKTRGEVRGGGKKPWKQKGTGRARHGSIRSPIWKGGGITFGPRPDRNFEIKINKKMKRQAMCMVLSQRARDGKILLISDLSFEKPKTKTAAQFLQKLPIEKKKNNAMPRLGIVTPKGIPAIARSFRNIPFVEIAPAHSLNISTLLKSTYLVFPLQGLQEVEGVFTVKKHL